MIFGKIFHLSKEGSKAIVQAGIWLALFNLAALLPVILLAMASEKMITLYYADSEAKISLLPYALALAVSVYPGCFAAERNWNSGASF